jgi:hypothetical protein
LAAHWRLIGVANRKKQSNPVKAIAATPSDNRAAPTGLAAPNLCERAMVVISLADSVFLRLVGLIGKM